MTKTWAVTRFELAYQLSRGSTRIYFAIFLGCALVLTRVVMIDARNDGYFFNAPIVTVTLTVIASMIALLIAAGVAGDAATRDAEVRMDSLIYTTPVGKKAYLGGRFLGAFGITAMLLLAVPIGLLLATRMPGVEPQLLGPFRVDAYLASYLLFAIPNAFVATAVLFSMAALTRRAIASYAGAAMLFFSAFISEGFIASRLGHWGLGRLLDPLGFTTVRAVWRSFNPQQKNTLLGLDAAMLTNRALWLGVACAVLAFAYARFRFAPSQSPLPAPRGEGQGEGREFRKTRPSPRPSPRRGEGESVRTTQLFAIATHSFRDLLASRAWWIVPITALIFIATAPQLLQVELGTPGAATTARVATMLGASELARLIILLIALSAGELVWRERDARINALIDVTPVPVGLSLCGKFLAIALMLAATQLVFLAAGVIVQTMLGFPRFELGLYLAILFGFQLSGYLLFAALAIVVHVLVNQKYVGNVIAILAYFAISFARELGVKHNLLLYGGAPDWWHSDIAGFGAQLGPWLWFTFYWSGWALLFGVIAYRFWRRGEERRRLTRGPLAIGAMAIAIILGAGGFIFYNTNVLNRYDTDADVEERGAEYERRYGKYASLPQPLLAATKLLVDFEPRRGAATIRGTYRLQNRSGVAIDTIHLATHSGVLTNDVSFDRPSRATLIDDRLGHRIYALGNALQPGQSVSMNFRIVFAPHGFTNDGRDATVMRNGSWIEHRGEQLDRQRQWLPAIGYQSGRELERSVVRAQHGLRKRPAVRPLEDLAARQEQRGHETIDFEAIVGTDADQIGVAPGELRRTWSVNGRRYAHYVSDAPIGNIYAIFSARYAVHRARWRDVDIEIFHHPAHTANLERMVRSARASLDYHTRNFGPYPHRQLRLVEYPSAGDGLGLTAYPGTIKYSEGFALARPDADRRQIDLPFAVVAHEIAHQWWGHQLVPANVEGAPLLTESLAWCSSMMVVEQALGREHLIRLLDVMRAQSIAPHQTREVPLLRAVDRIDAYRTGPFAMFALREAIGEERINTALRRLLARPPYATSLDLYNELRAVTPAPMHVLLKDLFEEITYWDLRTKKTDVQPAANGRYRVTLHIEAQKLKGNAMGIEKPVPMDDTIDIAIFDADGRTIYRHPHRIRSGAQTITVIVTRPPARAAIDPDHALLDRNPKDNGAPASRAG